jgi:hypothetical protein
MRIIVRIDMQDVIRAIFRMVCKDFWEGQRWVGVKRRRREGFTTLALLGRKGRQQKFGHRRLTYEQPPMSSATYIRTVIRIVSDHNLNLSFNHQYNLKSNFTVSVLCSPNQASYVTFPT